MRVSIVILVWCLTPSKVFGQADQIPPEWSRSRHRPQPHPHHHLTIRQHANVYRRMRLRRQEWSKSRTHLRRPGLERYRL